MVVGSVFGGVVNMALNANNPDLGLGAAFGAGACGGAVVGVIPNMTIGAGLGNGTTSYLNAKWSGQSEAVAQTQAIKGLVTGGVFGFGASKFVSWLGGNAESKMIGGAAMHAANTTLTAWDAVQ